MIKNYSFLDWNSHNNSGESRKRSVFSADVNLLDLARAAASSVVRILTSKLMCKGTGFMISEKLLITNSHLIPSVDCAMNYIAEFNYELSAKNSPKAVTRFAFAPNDFFISSRFDDLDFTIVAIGERNSGRSKLSKFGYIPLVNNQTEIIEGKNIIIHHPSGGYKRITLLHNTIVAQTEEVIHYYGNTQSGSSGAPVFNSNFELIALHHRATPSRPALNKEGLKGPEDANEGIRIQAIIKRINEEKHKLSSKQQELINAALDTTFG